MNAKKQAVFCWAQLALCTFLVILNFTSMVTRPWLGLDYSRVRRVVTDVVDGSPAHATGLREGDRIVTINGQPVGPEVHPMYFARAGQEVPVVVERDGLVVPVTVVPITQEAMRRDHLGAGPRRALPAINSYLSFPLHLWMLGTAAALLLLRPDNKDARIAALAFASWAGGTFMFRLAGFDSILGVFPSGIRPLLMALDAAFIAFFFAFCLHFAIVFPSERTKTRRRWQLLPYVLALPIFAETLAHGMRRLRGDARPASMPWTDAYSVVGAGLLTAALATLAVRYFSARETNPRRRLRLVLLAMLPGSLAFVLGLIVPMLPVPYEWEMAVRLLHVPSMLAGAAIFAYAVLRHRMFNVRVLLRRSLQYALARGTLLTLMSLPLLGLGLFLWTRRRDSLTAVLTATPAVYIVILVPLFVVIRYRRRVFEALDRRFFREQYDARHLLLHVVSMIRGGSDMLVLSRAALDEIDRALHPKHLALWQLEPDGNQLHRGFSLDPPGRSDAGPLDGGGTLAMLLSTNDDPLDVHSRATRVLLQRLPESDREWLAAVDAHLVVPLLIDRRLVGLMVLGERKSEEPYSGEDRELLRLLGAQLALTFDYSRLKQSPSLVWAPVPASLAVHAADALQLCPRCHRCYPADALRCDADDQPLVPEPGVPRVIEDKYIVTKLLGRGGMGAVYQATQTRLNRPVAIKVLLAHLVGSATMRSRFEREARIVARLRHPGIVTIHDFGVLASGHAYLVMEYLDGDTLRKTIRSGAQPPERALALIRPIGEAVESAHRAGVVHRDLKPENIMLVRDPHAQPAPRVLDFGLAKMTVQAADDEATVVQATASSHGGGVVGTLMYMAPEVLSGHVADARADQYSLALIAFELLAGEHPLGASTDLASVVRGHTELPMISIRDRAPVSAAVAGAIDRALAKKPASRWKSVGEFVEALGIGT
jgi:GAF domain-containing protein